MDLDAAERGDGGISGAGERDPEVREPAERGSRGTGLGTPETPGTPVDVLERQANAGDGEALRFVTVDREYGGRNGTQVQETDKSDNRTGEVFPETESETESEGGSEGEKKALEGQRAMEQDQESTDSSQLEERLIQQIGEQQDLMESQSRRIPSQYGSSADPNALAIALARREVATRRAQLLHTVVQAAVAENKDREEEMTGGGLRTGLVCAPVTRLSPRQTSRDNPDSTDDQTSEEENWRRADSEPEQKTGSRVRARHSRRRRKRPQQQQSRQLDPEPDLEEDLARYVQTKKKKKKHRKRKGDDKDPSRPVRSDVVMDAELAASNLQQAAMAADAEIGRQIYDQQAYTTQTVFAEVQKQKQDFEQFIENLIALLKMKSNVLRLKLQSYRNRFTTIQTVIFYGSIIIALITGFRVMFAAFRGDTQALDVYNGALIAASGSETTAVANSGGEGESSSSQEVLNSIVSSLTPAEVLAFDLVVFVLSTAISAISNTADKRGWSKKADAMSTVFQQVQMVINSLPESQMQIKFVSLPEEMHLLRTSFMTQQFKLYTNAIKEMSNYLSFQSLTNHMPDQYSLNIRHLEDEHAYQQRLLNIFISQQGDLKRLASK